jgi:tetratricopeptide (TPR) repeat protein
MNRFPSCLSRVILLVAALTAAPQAFATPDLVSKILRSFWLQSPPGRQGNAAYEKGDYEGALRGYAQAGAEARAGAKPADPALSLNTGHALYRQKKYAEAAEAYGRALSRSTLTSARDSAFAARAHYNLGNARYQKGATADTSAVDAAVADLREALARYKKALQLEPQHREAKQNLERAQDLLQQLLKRQEQNRKNQNRKQPEPSARAKEALARALQLTEQRRYPEARSVLENILRIDPTAAPYRSHLQRLDDVMRILKGQDPLPPIPADPRAQQKGMAL